MSTNLIKTTIRNILNNSSIFSYKLHSNNKTNKILKRLTVNSHGRIIFCGAGSYCYKTGSRVSFHGSDEQEVRAEIGYEAFRVFLSSKYSGESVLNIVFFRKIREKATALFSWK